MNPDQVALLIGVIAAAPLIVWIVWKAIRHGSGNT
jgi:Sec-independent protein secretion pathway component TatC